MTAGWPGGHDLASRRHTIWWVVGAAVVLGAVLLAAMVAEWRREERLVVRGFVVPYEGRADGPYHVCPAVRFSSPLQCDWPRVELRDIPRAPDGTPAAGLVADAGTPDEVVELTIRRHGRSDSANVEAWTPASGLPRSDPWLRPVG